MKKPTLNIYILLTLSFSLEQVGRDIHVSVFKVGDKFLNLNLFNFNIGHNHFLGLVQRHLFLPVHEQVQDTLPDHVVSRVTQRSLEVL